MKLSGCFFVLFFFTFLTAKSEYDPSKIFVPDFYKYKGNDIRSVSGKPASGYWQNEANYTINANFDVESFLLKGQKNMKLNYVNL